MSRHGDPVRIENLQNTHGNGRVGALVNAGETYGHADCGSALLRQCGASGTRARVDQGPAQTQPCSGGDEDRGQFQQPVRKDESEKGVEPAGRGHQARG